MGKRAAKFSAPDLRGILARARKECRWTEDEAEYAKLWYTRFLEMSWQNKGKPVYYISRKGDCLWHAHILYSRRYRAYCDKVFGQYLDHTPTNPRFMPAPKLRKRANVMYKLTYGGLPPDAATCCY
jgi:hypothetical protein